MRDDVSRWELRYRQRSQKKRAIAPDPELLAQIDAFPRRGLALDIACGLGDASAVLLQRGLDVVGADASHTALTLARQRLADAAGGGGLGVPASGLRS